MTRATEFLAWCVSTFGPLALDPKERALRFVEEAIELGQVQGITADEIGRLAARVYSRPAGALMKELAQCAATLELLHAALAANEIAYFTLDTLAETEFARVRRIPLEEWRRRHKAKSDIGIADVMVVECPGCGGTGMVDTLRCAACKGTGVAQ